MKKLNADAVLKRVETFVDRVIDCEVIPYYLHLLNTAQAKTKYALNFNTSMGAICLYCDAPWQKGSWVTPEYIGMGVETELRRPDRVARCREKFPELIELFQLVQKLGDTLDPGDMAPSVPCRRDDGSQDPADYVEDGPIVQCRGKKCKFRDVSDNFIFEKGKPLCTACVNGQGPWKGPT